MDGEELPKVDAFKYLGSVIDRDGTSQQDVQSRVWVGWMKWRELTGVLCDKNMPVKMKSKVYRTVVRPAMMYGSECWEMRKSDTKRMEVAERKMLRSKL